MKQSKIYRQVSTKGLAQSPDVHAQPAAMRYLWRIHCQSCLRRDVSNLITITDYAVLSAKPCYYCGREPFNKSKQKASDNLLYNGMDRLDNTKPYTIDNIVTCCKDCNAMKSNLTSDAFLTHVFRITHHMESIIEMSNVEFVS